MAGEHVDVKPGNAMPLANMPVGTIVHNIEMKIGKGGQIARSAGTYAQIVGRDAEYVNVRLIRRTAPDSWPLHGAIGAVSNPDKMNTSVGKAGRSRWLGRTPTQSRRDDEPGRSSAWRRRRPHLGRPPSGHALGQDHQGMKTRKNKATNKFILASRHVRRRKVRNDRNVALGLERPFRRRLSVQEGG